MAQQSQTPAPARGQERATEKPPERPVEPRAPVREPEKHRYRVSLPACKVRQVDAEGRVVYQDFLDVEAISEADAFQEFRRFNGIISTTQVPTVTRLED